MITSLAQHGTRPKARLISNATIPVPTHIADTLGLFSLLSGCLAMLSLLPRSTQRHLGVQALGLEIRRRLDRKIVPVAVGACHAIDCEPVGAAALSDVSDQLRAVENP